MSNLWAKYVKLLDTKPLITKAITSGVLVGGGDMVAQLFVEKNKQYDFARTLRFGTFGALAVGPMMHYWYAILQRFFPGDNFASAVKKLACDQIIFAPTIVASFFVGITLLEGNGFDTISRKFASDYIPAMKMNYYIWPAAQTITFTVIPYNLRVPWVSCVSLVWNTVLSLITNKQGENQEETKIVALDEKKSN